MNNIEQLKQAVLEAHKNGDKKAAELFANDIKKLQSQEQPTQPMDNDTRLANLSNFITAPVKLDALDSNTDFESNQPEVDQNLVQSKMIENKEQGIFKPKNEIVAELSGKDIVNTDDEGNAFTTGVSTASTILSSAVAEPIAGLAGLATTIGTKVGNILGLTEKEASQVGTDTINAVRDAITINPNAGAEEVLTKVAETIEEITPDALKGSQKKTGEFFADIGEDLFGEEGRKIGGAFGETLFEGITIAAGAGTGKVISGGINKSKNLVKAAKSDIDENTKNILDIAEEKNIPILTSDIIEPKTAVGKIIQTMNEKIPIVGTGKIRAKQQEARTAVVQDLIDEFQLEKGTTPEIGIIDDIKEQNFKKLEIAQGKRKESIDSLNTHGKVSTRQTKKIIDDVIKKEKNIGSDKIIDSGTINFLEGIKDSINSRDFGELADVRKTLINRIMTVKRGEDQGSLPKLQRIKSSIDKDMKSFGFQNDKNAISKWNESNKEFAEELTASKETTLKNILKKGDFDERKVKTIIESGSIKQLNTLKNALSPVGISKVKDSIIKTALDDAKAFDNINPDRFITSMQKLKRDKSLSVFFDSKDKKKIDGIINVMDATRRAQKASIDAPTGDRVLGAVGVGAPVLAIFEPTTFINTLIGGATLKGFNKIYNSKPVRNILIKLADVKKNSPAETKLIKEFGALLTQANDGNKEGEGIDITVNKKKDNK